MINQLTTLATLLGVIGVLCLVGYAVGQFLRAADCRRKRPEYTLATQWRAFTPPQRTGRPMKHEHEHLLGAAVRDVVTGLSGIAISVSYFVNGCVRICIQPRCTDNKPATEVEWVDLQQVEKISAGVRPDLGLIDGNGESRHPLCSGGPQKDAPRS